VRGKGRKWREWRGGSKGGGRGKGEEMTQTLYAHMDKIHFFKKRTCIKSLVLV
jgi:hypothetical protein